MKKFPAVAFLSAILVCCQSLVPVIAQTAPAEPIHLDLTSTERILPASHHEELTAPITINVGDSTRTISSIDSVTAAEFVAISQVLQTGQQQINIGQNGAAIGGTFTVTNFATNLGNLVVPSGVTGIHDAGVSETVSLAGNLTNAGTIYALSQNAIVTNAVFNATNIINQQNGTITSILPATGLPGFTSAMGNLNLVLTAANDVLNYGTITSSGSLSVTAGGSIMNQPELAAPAAALATMQAAQAVNLSSLSGNIVNHGIVESLASNINLNAQTASLIVDAVGGSFKSMLGDINVRDQLFDLDRNTMLWGGDYVSQALNVNTGLGIADVNVKNLAGVLNINGGCAYVMADSALHLGEINLSGDPTFYSTAFIELSNNLVFPSSHLALVAVTDIYVKQGNTISIDTGGPTFGGQINVFAGTTFRGNDPAKPLVVPPDPGSTSVLTIIGGSGPGGKIDFSQVTAINSTGGTSGNNITLLAWSGTTPDSGTIRVAGPITAGAGSSSGANGRIIAIGGAAAGTAVQLGDINNNGTANGNGGIFIRGDNPELRGCTTCTPANTIDISNGMIISGRVDINQDFVLTKPSSIVVGNITSASNISISSGAHAQLGTITSNGSNNFGTASNTLNGGRVYLRTNQVLDDMTTFVIGTTTPSINGTPSISVGSGTSTTGTTRNGQIVVLTKTSGGINVDSFSNLAYLGSGHVGGSLNLNAQAGNINLPSGTFALNAGGGNGSGGGINLSGNNINSAGSLNLSANGAGTGNGGLVDFNARNGAISLAGTLTATTNAPTGSGGRITLRSTTGSSYSSGLNLNAQSAGTGSGGTVEALNVSSLGATTLNANSSNGSGGWVTVEGSGTLMTGAGAVDMQARGPSSGGRITFNPGNLTTGAGTVSMNVGPTAASGPAGIIEMTGGNFNIGSGGLTANADGNASPGGVITASITSVTNTSGGAFSMDAKGDCATCYAGQVLLSINEYSGSASQPLSIDIRGLSGSTGGIVEITNKTGNNDLSISDLSIQASNTKPGVLPAASFEASDVSISAAGNISLPNMALDVSSNGGTSTGGTKPTAGSIDINAGGTLSINRSVISASATGSDGHGGIVSIKGASLNNAAGNLHIAADASGAGNGGNASLHLTGASTTTLGGPASNVTLSANGGSLSSSNGNAGAISVRTGGSLSVNSGALSAQALGLNGSAGSITIVSSEQAAGLLDINSDIVLKGVGNANGGTITIQSGSDTILGGLSLPALLDVSGVGTGHAGMIDIKYFDITQSASNRLFVGQLLAEAPSTGNGGAILISNRANGGHYVDIVTALSAESTSGIAGTITFVAGPAQLADVSGTGNMEGKVFLTAKSINIVVPNTQTLKVGALTATLGDIILNASAVEVPVLSTVAASSVPVLPVGGSSTASSPLLIDITTNSLIVNGSIRTFSSAPVRDEIIIHSPSTLQLSGNGTIELSANNLPTSRIRSQAVNSISVSGSLLLNAASGSTEMQTPSFSNSDQLASNGSLTIATTDLTNDGRILALGANAVLSITDFAQSGSLQLNIGTNGTSEFETDFTGGIRVINRASIDNGLIIFSGSHVFLPGSQGTRFEQSAPNGAVGDDPVLTGGTGGITLNSASLQSTTSTETNFLAPKITLDASSSLNATRLVIRAWVLSNAGAIEGDDIVLATSPTQDIRVSGGGTIHAQNSFLSSSFRIIENQPVLAPGIGLTLIGQAVTANLIRVINGTLTLTSNSSLATTHPISGDIDLRVHRITNDGLIKSGNGSLRINATNARGFDEDFSLTGIGTLDSTASGTITVENNRAISIDQNQIIGVVSATSIGSTTIVSDNGSLNIRNITANGGSITVVANGPSLTLQDGSSLDAKLGTITLQNLNSTGTLSTGIGSVLSSGGDVLIYLGAAPPSPTAGSRPSNVTVQGDPTWDRDFYGTGITSLGASTINVEPGSGRVVFNGGPGITINNLTINLGFLPIGYGPLLSAPSFDSSDFVDATFVFSSNSDVAKANHGFVLRRGHVLVIAKAKTTLQTPFSSVTVGPGSMVVVSVDEASSRVYTLVDRHRGDVFISMPVHTVITAGEMFACGPGSLQTNSLATRNEHLKKAAGLETFIADVSISSLFANSDLLKYVAKSGQFKREYDKILKTAAAVHVATYRRGRYSQR